MMALYQRNLSDPKYSSSSLQTRLLWKLLAAVLSLAPFVSPSNAEETSGTQKMVTIVKDSRRRSRAMEERFILTM